VVATHVLGLRAEFNLLAPWLVDTMVAFNMPLFAFLSGWVLVGREGSHPLRFLKGKALGLLVPYVAWVAVELPLRHVAPADLLPRLGLALLDPHAGLQMWFLPVLFWMFVIFAAGRLVSRSDAWTAALGIAVGSLLLFEVPRVLALDKIAWLYPFLIGGYLVSKYRDRLTGRHVAVAAAGVTALLGLLVAVGHAPVAWRYAAALIGLGAAWALYAVLPRPALDVQAWIGRRTLGVYGAQMVVLPYLIVGSGWVGALASWALVLAASCVVAFGLERWVVTRAVFSGRWPRPKARTDRGATGVGRSTSKEEPA
jgi:fucose 4-O-acetylase-like acetyltransferase